MVALVSPQPQPQQNMIALVSRTGRHLQRYSNGRRQVVGCIPYKYKAGELQVLVISSKKGKGMLFPKGGWEKDESKEEAAIRETIEEAGVKGVVELELGKWSFMSKTHHTLYDGYMFPLLVQEQFEFWPEKNFRQRRWV
ncbi:hypothetical protein FNV43_RR14879 [Rhamnella rubrinervis]|uniref:Nudix hydrolase domain-containing protein n=1 Tax=Rhamnella rubrinervis TaxID=2594499 RepID=A0A8K0H454_9ROSA|nr:hypothetical protein FNV43_RR14879 [Rhamnella rubrinervis]